jgi:hypothetical protein
VAFLFLALGQVGRVRTWPGHLHALSRLLPPGAFLRTAIRSPRRARGSGARFAVTDDPASDARGSEGRVLIDYDYFNPASPNGTLVAPFFLHPHYYASGLYRTLPGLRDERRDVRLFFAGTSNPTAYTRSFASGLFPIMDRSAVLAAVQEDFRSETLVVRRREDAGRIARSGKPIVLVLTDRTEDTLAKHLLGPRQYLRLLAGSAFSLCPPGWIMPFSHNLIEAMAVGTVPVLSYETLLDPPLVPRENCLSFRDRDELRSAIRLTLSANDAEISDLRAATARRYDQSLSVGAFAARLFTALKSGGEIRVRFNGGERSVLHRPAPPG